MQEFLRSKKTSNLIPERAVQNQKSFYNDRYKEGYMQGFVELYEACRLKTIKEILTEHKKRGFEPRAILDYGCGEGRYIAILRNFFPHAEIYGSDISDVALNIAQKHDPRAHLINMNDEGVKLPDNFFDLIICVEVLEHVRNAPFAAQEIGRMLRPGAMALLTTPCANKYSLEWFYNKLTGGLEPSLDGYGRFATDEPAHLRRLNDAHMKTLFGACGVDIFKIYHRAHFFTLIAAQLNSKFRGFSEIWTAMALLDWRLFKHLPNGATMVALGAKTGLEGFSGQTA